MDYDPPGSSFHGISQARILEWVATVFSRVSDGFFTTEPPGKPDSRGTYNNNNKHYYPQFTDKKLRYREVK